MASSYKKDDIKRQVLSAQPSGGAGSAYRGSTGGGSVSYGGSGGGQVLSYKQFAAARRKGKSLEELIAQSGADGTLSGSSKTAGSSGVLSYEEFAAARRRGVSLEELMQQAYGATTVKDKSERKIEIGNRALRQSDMDRALGTPAAADTAPVQAAASGIPDNDNTMRRWMDQILGIDSTQVSGEKTDWGKLVKGIVRKGLGESDVGLVGGLNVLDKTGQAVLRTANPVVGYLSDEMRVLGKQTLNDVIGGVNGVFGSDIKYIDEGESFIDHWLESVKKKHAANQEYFAENANTSRAAQIADKFGTSFVAAVPQAIEAIMLGKIKAAEYAGIKSAEIADTAASGALQYASRLAGSKGAHAAGIMAAEGMKNTFRNPQFWTSYLEAIGSGYESGKEAGMSDADAELYSLVNGFFNATIEIGGGDEDLGGFQMVPEKVRRAIANGDKYGLLNWFKDSVLGEGWEEVQQGAIERGLLQQAKGASAWDMFSNDPNNSEAAFNPWMAGEEFAGGAVVGGMLGGAETAITKGLNTRTYRGDTQALVSTARESGGSEGAARAEEIQRAAEKRGRMTREEAGELYSIIEGSDAVKQYEQKAQNNAEKARLGGILQSAFQRSNYSLTDKQAAEMAERFDPQGEVSMQDYVLGTREAYRMGSDGVRLQQAIQSSEYAARLTPEQFNRAWALGASAQSNQTETADVGTEAGKTRLDAALNALGKHAAAAAEVYEKGQDVNTFSAAMNKAAALYAANGTDLRQEVQDAREGKTADIVGQLTDAQVDRAIEIGSRMRAERQAEIQASASRFRTLRQQAAALGQQASAALGDVNKALSEARAFGKAEMEAFNQNLAALEAMVKADPSAENTEAYEKAYDEALKHRENVEKTQKLVEDLEAKHKEVQQRQAGKRKKGTVSYDGGTLNGKTVKAVDRNNLNRQQKKAAALVEALADAVNIDYVLFDGDAKGAQGAYVQGGTVFVNINAGMATGKSLAAATLSHELTHYLQDYAPEEYQALKDFIVSEVLGRTPGQFDALVRRQLRVEPDLSYDEAVDEVIANACQTMLQNSRAVTELARQNMTLAEKIADVIENISGKIKAAFEEVSTDELAFKNAVKAVEGELDRVQAMWDKALTAATENYNAEQSTQTAENENTAPEGGVKLQSFKGYDEALAYILPDNADSDVVQALQERGYNVLTYKAGDEQDRLQKLNSVDGARFQKWDDDYAQAVQNGDTETEKKLVAQAAKRSGYQYHGYHGTLATDFTEFKKEFVGTRFSFDEKGFFFIDRKSIAKDYATSEFDSSRKGRVIDAYLRIRKPLVVDKAFVLKEGLGNIFRDDDVIDAWDNYSSYFIEEADNMRADGIIVDDGSTKMFVVFDGEQIKSAEPVTYDDAGNVIPLSSRFNRRERDFRFQQFDSEAEADYQESLRLDEQIREAEDALEFEDDSTVRRTLNNRLTKLYSEKDKLVAKERRLSRKTSIDEILNNLSRYRYNDLESLAEQYSDGAWDIEPGTPREQLEDELREALEERAADMTPLQRQAPRMGLYVRPVGETSFQHWDDSSDDTAAEANGRELAYSRLQSENAILGETVKALQKLTSKQDNTIEKLQNKLRLTKTPEVRESDARKLARTLLKENSSQADADWVAQELKAIGDYILQTPVDEVSEEEIKNRARGVAAEILGNASEQVGIEDETWQSITKSIRGKKLTIDPAFFGELDGGFDTFRKSMFGKLTIASAESQNIDRSEYSSVSQFYADLQSEYGTAYFPNLANEGEELRTIARVFELTQPTEVNPFDQYMGEATEELANRIVMDAMSGVLRVNPPSYADTQKARRVELNERIKQLRDEQKMSQREAERLFQTVYDLSVALDKAESKYRSLRTEADYRTAQVRAEGKARAAEIKAAERAKAAEDISALKAHYRQMQRDARERRTNTGTRNRIRKLIADLNNRLRHPTENRHVPRELMQATLDVLNMIDLDTGRGSTAAAERIADIRAMYEGYKNNPTYQIAYDETTADMLDQLALTVRGKRLADMNETQLRAVYETLKSLTHVIDNAVKVRIGNEERSAFEIAKEMTAETRAIPKAQKGWLREHFIPSHLRADVAFRRFGGFKKGSAWEKVSRILNDGQLKETRLRMELSRPFEKIFGRDAALRDFTGVNGRGRIDSSKLVDIGLKDAEGRSIPVTHDFMVGIYMDLNNEDNRRHFINGGKTIPNLQDYYDGKGGWGSGAVRSVGIAERLSELNRQLDEAKRGNYADWAEEIRGEIEDLKNEGERYADEVKAAIEKNLSAYDREWIDACRQLMDVDSKRELNRTTMDVYGIEKASVPNYWPITSDPDFLSKPMDSVTKDMSLENVGFMKDRIKGANPSLALGTVQVVTRQIDRVAHYCGMMPALRSFGKIWNKTEAGYADSVKKATREVFQKSGVEYIENLIADLTGSRSVKADELGLDRLLGKLRGNLAQSTLTLNPRVALAQAASFPTAAAEVGWKNIGKALARGGKNGRIISGADTELIAKWSPLLWYRMQGYATPELGDIQGSNSLSSRLWRKARWATGWIQAVDGATVGRLWYAAEYWVQENQPKLEKGSDAYYEAVAEKFNAVVEKTQPNYTTMQRAAILRSPSTLVKTFTMFMTQRLQNANILYDATASYQKARADLANGRNGVTREDVSEARNNLVLAVSSQLVQTAVFVGFKAFTDALLHNMNRYRDEDSGDLTEESVSMAILDAYIDAMVGSVIGGSELYGAVKAMTGHGKWYGLSVSGVDTVNDLMESLVKLANTETDWSDAGSRQKLAKQALKVGTNVAQAFGIPAANAVKIGQMVKNHAQDAANGEFLSFEAGYERTKAQLEVKSAVDAGVPKDLYMDTVKKANTDGKSGVSQDELGTYLNTEVNAGRITPQQANTIWSVQSWSTSYDKWQTDAAQAEEKSKNTAAKVAEAGLTLEEYEALLDAADANGNKSVTQDELGEYLLREISAGRIGSGQADEIWSAAGTANNWKKSFSKWRGGKSPAMTKGFPVAERMTAVPKTSGVHGREKRVGSGTVKVERGRRVAGVPPVGYTSSADLDDWLERKHDQEAEDYYEEQLEMDRESYEEWDRYVQQHAVTDTNFFGGTNNILNDSRIDAVDAERFNKAYIAYNDAYRDWDLDYITYDEFKEITREAIAVMEEFYEKYYFIRSKGSWLPDLQLVDSKGNPLPS